MKELKYELDCLFLSLLQGRHDMRFFDLDSCIDRVARLKQWVEHEEDKAD